MLKRWVRLREQDTWQGLAIISPKLREQLAHLVSRLLAP